MILMNVNDLGTTLILLASNGYSKYKTATGAVLDGATGLLRITSAQFSALQSLFFTAGGVRVFLLLHRRPGIRFDSYRSLLFPHSQTTFELTANAQLWPRSLNTDIGGLSSRIYLIVNNLGTPSGEGLDFINGQTFLERFYAVFDTAGHRVGLATTPFTDATTN